MPQWQDVDDAQLLIRSQAGDAEAFGALYERNAQAIYRFLLAHLNDPMDVEDLTEEVFYRVWRSRSTYEERGIPFTAYLYQVARNVLVDHYRRNKHSAQNVELDEGQLAYHDADPADMVSNSLENQEIRELLIQLRDDYREVLVLRFFNQMSPEETAQAMQRSVGAIRVLQHRALTAVRKLLARDRRE